MAEFPRGGRRRYVLLLMVLAAVTLATLDSRSGDSGPIGAAGRTAHRIVQPVSNAASSVFSPFHDWWHGFTHHGDIVDENRDLRQQLQEERAKAQAGADAIRENRQFKQMFNYPFQNEFPNVNARVVAATPGNFETGVTLNVGTEKGIAPGMAVVGAEGLIGRVVEAWQGGSTVLLVSDPSFGAAVRPLLAPQFLTANTGSDGRLGIVFDEPDPERKNSALKAREGDTIVTCGCNGSRYPLGIPVGTVRSAIRSADRSKVTIVLQSFLDRSSLELVKVITWKPGDKIPAGVEATTRPSTTTTTIPVGPNSTTTTGPTTTTSAGG